MGKENFQGTLLETNSAESTFFGIDDINPFFLGNHVAWADLLTTPALVADMDFKGPGGRELSLDMDGCLFGVVLFKMG
jgi:hypothetical protein